MSRSSARELIEISTLTLPLCSIWAFGSLAVGALCSLIAFGYLKGTDPAFIQDSSGLVAVIVGYVRLHSALSPDRRSGADLFLRGQSFAIGYFICYSLGYGALSSGVSTTFVALAGTFSRASLALAPENRSSPRSVHQTCS